MSKKQLRQLECIDLMLDDGEIVRIQVPREYFDECLEHIEIAMKQRDWFVSTRWDGCNAKCLGTWVERVNMAKVVAML